MKKKALVVYRNCSLCNFRNRHSEFPWEITFTFWKALLTSPLLCKNPFLSAGEWLPANDSKCFSLIFIVTYVWYAYFFTLTSTMDFLYHKNHSSGWGIGLWFIAKTMIYCTQEQWFVNVKDRKSIDSHCKISTSLILDSHTRYIPKNCPSRIFTACRSDWGTSWECFMYKNPELSC